VPVDEQVVVIEHGGGFLAVDVGVEQSLQLVAPFQAPGVAHGEHLGEFLAGVDAAAVDRHAGSLLGKPPVGPGQGELGADHVHQVFRVGAIVDRETRRQADGLAVLAQHSRGDRVEGAAPDAGRKEAAGPGLGPVQPAEHAVGAAEHLGGGAAGEGQQEDSLRRRPPSDQPGHAVDQRRGLARARPGHDQERTVAVLHGLALLGIESGEDLVNRRFSVHFSVNFVTLRASWSTVTGGESFVEGDTFRPLRGFFLGGRWSHTCAPDG